MSSSTRCAETMDISCKVHIGDLGKHVSYHKLKDVFSEYGRVKHVWVARNPPGVVYVYCNFSYKYVSIFRLHMFLFLSSAYGNLSELENVLSSLGKRLLPVRNFFHLLVANLSYLEILFQCLNFFGLPVQNIFRCLVTE